MFRVVFLSVVLSLAAGCAGSMPSVAVKGSIADRTQLAGEWKGVFEALDAASKGDIQFSLQAGRHTGSGALTVTSDAQAAQSVPHGLKYIEVTNGMVVGKVEPYQDPKCSCKVETEFEGALTGNVIEGTFTTHYEGQTQTNTGWWSVERL